MRNTRLARATTLAVAVPALGAAVLLAHPGGGDAAAAAAHGRPVDEAVPQTTIASSTAHDFRVVVDAARTTGGRAPSATVYVKAYNRSDGGWRRLGDVRLGARDGFFWDTLTGSHAVRDFTISNSEPRGGSVRLLLSPALGWSPAYHFHISHGRLVR
jgi:hypothetical protein